MKNYFKSTIAFSLFSVFAFSGCFDIAPGATDAQASLKQTVSQSISNELADAPCGFDDRKTTGMLKERTAIVVAVRNLGDRETPTFILDMPDEGRRFVACNMPDEIKIDGVKVTFDGEIKEIYDYERWMAHPMKLTKIHKMDGSRGETASNSGETF
ncbi:hypothetical protein [Adhaeribacter soli]|uniref:Lipoprotein n=1 Tax=Adhaeribacter soli TaxID=2607655 RepID=A0A5N1IKE5_9BACT|nr:hypothetical protein [Adhaeribacter soli]KAA9325998.1 hypothetical protein F0P94_16400 [Adhaeribacter soli]